MWAEVKGFGSRYRVSSDGEVQRRKRNGEWTGVTPAVKHGRVCVAMIADGGRRQYVAVSRLMAEAFLGGVGPDQCVIHRNTMKLDCSLHNLQVVPKRVQAGINGRCNRRAVLKIGADGDIVEVYPSAREAARREYVSETAMRRRCLGKTHACRWAEDCEFRYED